MPNVSTLTMPRLRWSSGVGHRFQLSKESCCWAWWRQQCFLWRRLHRWRLLSRLHCGCWHHYIWHYQAINANVLSKQRYANQPVEMRFGQICCEDIHHWTKTNMTKQLLTYIASVLVLYLQHLALDEVSDPSKIQYWYSRMHTIE